MVIERNKREEKAKRHKNKGVEGISRLAGYKYEHKFVYNQKTMRTNTVLTCKYGNCNKVYNKTWDLLDHMRKHTGEKPYQWKTCLKVRSSFFGLFLMFLKRFSQRGNVIKHKKMHQKERELAMQKKIINLDDSDDKSTSSQGKDSTSLK